MSDLRTLLESFISETTAPMKSLYVNDYRAITTWLLRFFFARTLSFSFLNIKRTGTRSVYLALSMELLEETKEPMRRTRYCYVAKFADAGRWVVGAILVNVLPELSSEI